MKIETHTNKKGVPYFSKTDENGDAIYSFSEDFDDIWDQDTQYEYGD